MDPTANLEEQLRIARRMRDCEERHGAASVAHAGTDNGIGPCTCQDDGERLADLLLALDEWIRKRGFLPEPWGRAADGHWAKKGGTA